jgi:hypothetical protein
MNLKKQHVPDILAIIIVTGVFFVAKTFVGERPRLFTFLIFSIVYYLLEDFRINNKRKAFLIPLLIMLLSNLHPAYIVCILLVTLYLAGEGIRYLFGTDNKDGRFKGLLMIWSLTIVFSMLNPNGPIALTYLFRGLILTHLSPVHSSYLSEYLKSVTEYMPILYLYRNKLIPLDYSYIVFLVFSLAVLRYLRVIGIIHVLLLAVFTFMSFVASRYMIFYMCAAAPIIARTAVSISHEKIMEKLTGKLKAREGLLNLIACIAGIFFLLNTVHAHAKHSFGEDTFYSFPKGAADFLGSVEINGNMFNEYAFGAYLIWRLYPDKKVFYDSRAVELDIYSEYKKVMSASEKKPLSWDEILGKYNISHIVIPPLYKHGQIYALVEQLFDSKDWVLIYADHLSFIFLKKDSDNEHVIKRFFIDKRKGLNTILVQASARAMGVKRNPYLLISIGKVFFKMGKMDDAKKAFMLAYERAPGNPVVKRWLKILQGTDTGGTQTKLYDSLPSD